MSDLQEVQIAKDGTFQFSVPAFIFEKSVDAAGYVEGQQRRIGGFITTELQDRDGETVLQKGLDFTDLLPYGWYLYGHSKVSGDVIGYPDKCEFIKKGVTAPNGEVAVADGYYAEGWLIPGYEPADKIWNLANALKNMPEPRRSLGFSVQGQILKRHDLNKKIITHAKVRHIAITHENSNIPARLDVLAKALRDASIEEVTEQVQSIVPPTVLTTRQAAERVLQVFPQATPQMVARIIHLAVAKSNQRV